MSEILTLLGILCGSGGLLSVLVSTYRSSKKIDESTELQKNQLDATNAQTNRNTLVGRLRKSQELLERRRNKEYEKYLEFIGTAYWRGNNKDDVKLFGEIVKSNVECFDESIFELSNAINDVYAFELTEAVDAERIIKRAEDSIKLKKTPELGRGGE